MCENIENILMKTPWKWLFNFGRSKYGKFKHHNLRLCKGYSVFQFLGEFGNFSESFRKVFIIILVSAFVEFVGFLANGKSKGFRVVWVEMVENLHGASLCSLIMIDCKMKYFMVFLSFSVTTTTKNIVWVLALCRLCKKKKILKLFHWKKVVLMS